MLKTEERGGLLLDENDTGTNCLKNRKVIIKDL